MIDVLTSGVADGFADTDDRNAVGFALCRGHEDATAG